MSGWWRPKTIFLIDEDSKRAVSGGAAGSAFWKSAGGVVGGDFVIGKNFLSEGVDFALHCSDQAVPLINRATTCVLTGEGGKSHGGLEVRRSTISDFIEFCSLWVVLETHFSSPRNRKAPRISSIWNH
jgi:hypothetical protein